jgi:hypothetical protein
LAKPKIGETKIIKRKRQGRHRDEDMRLVNFLRKHPFSSAIRAKVETNFPGSTRTSRKRIKESKLGNRSAPNKIFLSEANKEERLRFAFQRVWVVLPTAALPTAILPTAFLLTTHFTDRPFD